MATTAKSQFSIGQIVHFHDGKSKKDKAEPWEVIKYHQINKKWEIMFQSKWTNEHMSIPIAKLEEYM